MMKKRIWDRLGLIFDPKQYCSWVKSHASSPTPLYLEGSRYRIFFAGRNADQKSQVGFFDIDLKNPKDILYVSQKPVLEHGPSASSMTVASMQLQLSKTVTSFTCIRSAGTEVQSRHYSIHQ